MKFIKKVICIKTTHLDSLPISYKISEFKRKMSQFLLFSDSSTYSLEYIKPNFSNVSLQIGDYRLFETCK